MSIYGAHTVDPRVLQHSHGAPRSIGRPRTEPTELHKGSKALADGRTAEV